MNGRQQLFDKGYVVVRSSIDPNVLVKIRERMDLHKHKVSIDAEYLPNGYQGSVVDYVEIIDHASALLKSMGATNLWMTQSVLIPKFAGEKRRYWHHDVPPLLNATPDAPPPDVLFLQYYLDATTAGEGCLVIMPRHIQNFAEKDEGVAVGEVPIPVECGDVIVMDPRIAHATQANTTDKDRLLIRLQIECDWERN